MAMFGASAGKAASSVDPSSLSTRDKWVLFGSALKDAGAGLAGRDSDALLQAQAMLGARQQADQKQQFLKMLSDKLGPQYAEGSPAPTVAPRGMIGGSAPSTMEDPSGAVSGALGAMAPGPTAGAPAPYQYQPPQRTSNGLAIDSPELPALALKAQQLGIPLTGLIDIMKANQADIQVGPDGTTYNKKDAGALNRTFANRDNINGFLVNKNDAANEGRYFPKIPDGMSPDGRGGVGNLPGLLPSMGAQEETQTRGRTMGTVFNRPNGDGSTTPMLGADMFGGRPGPSGGFGPAPGGAGRTQAPSDAAAAKIEAEAAANARVGLPQVVQQAEQALGLITQMKSHPSLKARTGLSGMLPAFPGTKDVGFDAMAAQIKGKTFLEAFQSLKGAGQITEVEGQKATEAIARLDRAQSAEDYTAALTDLENVIRGGLARSQKQAGGPARTTSGPTMQGRGFKILSVE